MAWLSILVAVLVALGFAAPAFAQDDLDSIKVDPAHHKVVFENEQIRVVRWTVPPGGRTLQHSHPANLLVDLTDYDGLVTMPLGKTFEVHANAGTVGWRQAGIHVVENLGSRPMEGLIVEPKHPASARPAGSADPAVVDAQHQAVTFENEQIRVLRERQSGAFPMHGHPDNLQILLSDLNVSVTKAGGNTQTVTGKAGDVRWRTATEHAGQVLDDTPMDQIVIEMKGVQSAPREIW